MIPEPEADFHRCQLMPTPPHDVTGSTNIRHNRKIPEMESYGISGRAGGW
jgi:hypothetical protein